MVWWKFTWNKSNQFPEDIFSECVVWFAWEQLNCNVCLPKEFKTWHTFNSYCGMSCQICWRTSHLSQTYSYSTTDEMYLFLKLIILVKHSTCFWRSLRPLSGAQNCTHGNRHVSNSRVCSFELLMIDGGTVRNMYSVLQECIIWETGSSCWLYCKNILWYTDLRTSKSVRCTFNMMGWTTFHWAHEGQVTCMFPWILVMSW